jgi:hypothetical protein
LDIEMFEQSAFRKTSFVALLVSSLIAMSSPALAQGSAGGSIGNDDKSLSGSRPEPRTVVPERHTMPQEEEPRRSTSRSGGGGVGGFDGAWAVVAIGTTCRGTASGAIVITSGRIIGRGVSGHVSPNGAATAVGNDNGVLVNSSGRFSGRNGSGTYRRSDGCMGRWTASKQ